MKKLDKLKYVKTLDLIYEIALDVLNKTDTTNNPKKNEVLKECYDSLIRASNIMYDVKRILGDNKWL